MSSYIAGILWLTLFSRVGTETRNILFPFHSYIEILKGNRIFLIENIGNIILFFPLGVAISYSKLGKLKRAVLLGFLVSLFIEMLQLIFSLGTFEIDDLIHNTIGTVIGFIISKKVNKNFEIKLNGGSIRIIIIFVLVFSFIPVGYGEIKHQKMLEYASLFDREDGTKNLLVLNGKNGYAWNTDVRIRYYDHGKLRIKGTSDKMSWWLIGEIMLKPGKYSFSGLSNVKSDTVGLELIADNQRLTPDVGPTDEEKFSLTKNTKISVYVVVYNGCDCDVVARPVIYKEE